MNIQEITKELFRVYSSALLSIVILFSFFLNDAKYIRLRLNVLWSIIFLFLSIIFSVPCLISSSKLMENWIGKDISNALFAFLFALSIFFFITSLSLLTFAFYKVYRVNTLSIKWKEKQDHIFAPDRVKTGIKELDESLRAPDNPEEPAFLFNSTFLLRATSNSHPWIFWEKLCENLLKRDDSTYMVYVCLNRPANVIIDEFPWKELPEMIKKRRAYFIDGFENVILNRQKDEKLVFNPFDINSLIKKVQGILFEEIKISQDKRVIIVVDSLSYVYKFAGNENALRFVFYLISLSSYYKVLNLLYYRKGILSQQEEVALENAVDSIIDFKGHSEGREKLKLTKIRLSKILKEEIEI